MRPAAFLIVLGLVALPGCIEGIVAWTEIEVYVDAPEAVAIAAAHPGFHHEKAGRSPLEPPADDSYGPLALSPDDVAVASIRWTKGHWPMQDGGRWYETVELYAEGSDLVLLSRDRASRGPEAMEPDVRRFLAAVADLEPAEADRIVDAHMATWSSRDWDEDDNAPASASSKVSLDVDVGRLLADKGLDLHERCCTGGEFVAATRYGTWDGWFVSIDISNWAWSGAVPGDEGPPRYIVVSAAGRLYVGGTVYEAVDRDDALAWARGVLDGQGFGDISLEGADLRLRPELIGP